MEKNNAGFGALIGFAYVFKEEVESITSSINGLVSIVLAEGVWWKKIYFTPGTGSWNEQSERVKGGKIWKQKAIITSTQDLEKDWASINLLNTRKVIVRLQFTSGFKLIGTMESSVSLDVSTDSGGGLGTGVSFEYEALERACWLQGQDVVIVFNETASSDNITSASADLMTYAWYEQSNLPTQYGFVYSTDADQLTLAEGMVVTASVIGHVFRASIDELEPGTTYYFRFYGSNEVDTYYGETKSFVTEAV
ncbi:MAG TPA: hypothetical protein DCL77_14385 [Prolixibacteraceae bacterium]|jgi:hypothetical protein|nr:hypothetical protein [Prolixibacteraceae bacterium]